MRGHSARRRVPHAGVRLLGDLRGDLQLLEQRAALVGLTSGAQLGKPFLEDDLRGVGAVLEHDVDGLGAVALSRADDGELDALANAQLANALTAVPRERLWLWRGVDDTSPTSGERNDDRRNMTRGQRRGREPEYDARLYASVLTIVATATAFGEPSALYGVHHSRRHIVHGQAGPHRATKHTGTSQRTSSVASGPRARRGAVTLDSVTRRSGGGPPLEAPMSTIISPDRTHLTEANPDIVAAVCSQWARRAWRSAGGSVGEGLGYQGRAQRDGACGAGTADAPTTAPAVVQLHSIKATPARAARTQSRNNAKPKRTDTFSMWWGRTSSLHRTTTL